MKNLMQAILKNIIKFIDVLRTAGIRVSHSESIDAVSALEHVNLLNRDEVRIALSACLAKSTEDKRTFNEAFERFFIDAGEKDRYIQSVIQETEQKKLEVNEKSKELKFKSETIRLDESLKEVYSALPEKERQSIRDFLDKTSSGKNVGDGFKPIAEAMVQSKLKSLQNKYPISRTVQPDANSKTGAEAGIIAGDVLEALKGEDDLLYKKLGLIHDSDIPTVIRLIEAMAQQLARSMARQKKNTGRKTRLDFSRTIERSLSTGGVPFKLKYRKKSKQKPRFLILCDVSASMHRFSGFVLQFISGMHSALVQPDCYIFSQEAEHINIHGFGNALKFQQQVVNSSIWRKGTDIGKALEEITQKRSTVLNSSVILLIVSDAKTLHAEHATACLKKLSPAVKKIIWLNPIPEEDWSSIPLIDQYREVSSMLDCSTLYKLRHAVSRL